jgi:hypothetical protein
MAVRTNAEQASETRGDVADAVMRAVGAEDQAREERRRRRRASAQRGFYAVGAVVVAAAAGLMLWTRHEAAAPTPRASAPSSAPSAVASEAAAEAGHEHGVEVWSVDFGGAQGAVFYVPSETSASGTTTVVWVSQDEAAGDSAGEDE